MNLSIDKDKLVKEVGSNHFLKVLAAIKRSMDLVHGESPLINLKSDKKSFIVLQEIKQKLVDEDLLLNSFFKFLLNEEEESTDDEVDDYQV